MGGRQRDALWVWLGAAAQGQVSGPWAALYRGLMQPASWLYRGLLACRQLGYRTGLVRTHAAAVPVISVGNLTTGGTGKTPFVQWLAVRLQSLGRRPAIVSRGYGAGRGSANDEARMIADNLPDVPHVLDPRRARGARVAVDKCRADCIILDDGFQHLALERDLDLVLIDASMPFGNGSVLPAGALREPVKALARADFVVLSRVDAVDADALARVRASVSRLAPGTPLAECIHAPASLDSLGSDEQREPGWLRERPVFWFCGLGHPRAFEATLTRLGAEVVGGRALPDHHRYRAGELEDMAREAIAAGAQAIVTTHKDRVKLTDFADWPLPAYSLRVEIRIVQGQEALAAAVDRAVGPAEPANCPDRSTH